MKNDYDRQCHSCGGFCKKSGCERENVKTAPDHTATGKQSLQVDRIDTSQERVEKSNGNRHKPVACPVCGNQYLAIRTDIYKDQREFYYCDCCGAMADKKTWMIAVGNPAPDGTFINEGTKTDHTATGKQSLQVEEICKEKNAAPDHTAPPWPENCGSGHCSCVECVVPLSPHHAALLRQALEALENALCDLNPTGEYEDYKYIDRAITAISGALE